MKKKEMPSTYREEKEAVERKQKKDRIKRTLIFGTFGVCACVAILLLLIGSIASKFMTIQYPESTLSSVRQESISTKAYEDMTQVIKVGQYYMCIPNANVTSATEGMLILEDTTHTFVFAKTEASQDSTLEKDLPFIINSIGASSYKKEYEDKGYLNTIKIAYVAGSAKARGNIYFVSYEVFTATEKLEILITAKNQGNLNLAKDYLDRMIDTIVLDPELENAADENGEGVQEDTGILEDASEVVPEEVNDMKSFSKDGNLSEYSYDESYPELTGGASISTDDVYNEEEGAIFLNITNVTTDVMSDRVYCEVTLFFPVSDEADTHFGSDAGDCYLVDLGSYEIRATQIDDSIGKSLTYVFELPNEKVGMINYYTLVIKDPQKKVERVYYEINSAKNSQYSPDYEPNIIVHEEIEKTP